MGDETSKEGASRPSPRVVAGNVLKLLRFFSRLPLPALPFEADAYGAPDFARCAPLLPLAGALLHGLGAAVLALGLLLRLPAEIAALLALATLVLTTGAFHEDGLADTADSLGGRSREQKLAIMRDSRIGTYGAAALFFSLALRTVLLSHLAHTTGYAAALVLMASGALSRNTALLLAVVLPPAQQGGAAFAVGQPGWPGFLGAASLSLLLTILLVLLPVGATPFAAGLLTCVLIGALAALVARHQFGGQTGDVAGACQQACETAYLLAMTLTLG